MRILVVGGAGYIGAHMCRALSGNGIAFAVLDDFSTGHERAVHDFQVYKGSLLSTGFVTRSLSDFRPDVIMHFAAKSIAIESVAEPAFYYRENILGILNLLDAMRAQGVNRLVFSSTAAVYGIPSYTPIDEDHPLLPINPYGRSKLYIERILEDYGNAYGLQSISLRYFNAAGAHHSGEVGEDHQPETHLIPNIINAALDGSPVQLFGNDYPTEDGFCVRDYIHVEDLCRAHLMACQHFDNMEKGSFEAINLGTESGASVKQVLDTCEKVLGRNIEYTVKGRRPGDPPALVASAAKAGKLLGWNPEKSDLETIIASAWQWHETLNHNI